MTSASPRHTEPLVEITRGELVESLHRGVIAVVDGNNKLLTHAGAVRGLSKWSATRLHARAMKQLRQKLAEGV